MTERQAKASGGTRTTRGGLTLLRLAAGGAILGESVAATVSLITGTDSLALDWTLGVGGFVAALMVLLHHEHSS